VLYVDENVGFADLKNTLYHFAKEMFEGNQSTIPPFLLPFTEPSAEIDITRLIWWQRLYCVEGSGWVEIGGSGMVDPNVLKKTVASTPKNTPVLPLNGYRTNCYAKVSDQRFEIIHGE
jgi:phenylalanyl-tRNA synthetase alpha chain